MKIALAQINTTVGAIQENARKIREYSERARGAGAEAVLFPELTLTGYPPLDLLQMPHFVRSQMDEAESLARDLKGITAVIGLAEPNASPGGKNLFNTAAVLSGGKVAARHRKRLLPTYDVFDEGRYFEPGGEFTLESVGGKKVGVSVCEDIWNDKDYWAKRKYKEDPVERLSQAGMEILFNISGSPFHLDKPRVRLNMLSNLAKKHRCWVLYTNLVGGNDSLVFDGHSMALSPDGSLRALAKGFEEDLLIVDLGNPPAPLPSPEFGRAALAYDALVLGLRDYVRKCGFSKVLVGLSGGIDSALTAAIAADALGPGSVRGVAMPSPYSSEGSVQDAYALADNLGVRIDKIPITPVFEAYKGQLAPALAPHEKGKVTLTEENLQARIRGMILMALSNDTGAMVLSTGNKSEYACGYSTLYGDMCGGLAVIGDAPKTLIYEMSRHVNRMKERIPHSSIEKPPSAELRPNQKDEDSLPPYSVLDPILEAYVEDNLAVGEIVAKGFDEATVRRVIRLVDRSEYKRRQAAPILRITHRAFGPGRQLPIAQRYEQG